MAFEDYTDEELAQEMGLDINDPYAYADLAYARKSGRQEIGKAKGEIQYAPIESQKQPKDDYLDAIGGGVFEKKDIPTGVADTVMDKPTTPAPTQQSSGVAGVAPAVKNSTGTTTASYSQKQPQSGVFTSPNYNNTHTPSLPTMNPNNPDEIVQPVRTKTAPSGATTSGYTTGTSGGVGGVTASQVKSPSSAEQYADLIDAAKRQAISGINNTTAGLVDKNTQEFLRDSNLGYDSGRQKQIALEQFDTERAKGLDAARAAMGDTSGGGEARAAYLDTALKGNLDRATLERQLSDSDYQRRLAGIQASLKEGRDTQGMNIASSNANIDLLGKAKGMGESDVAREQEANIINAKLAQEASSKNADVDLAKAGLSLDEAKLAEQIRATDNEADFKERALQAGYDEAAVDRAWKGKMAAFEDKTKRDIATINANVDVWKQHRVDELTRYGIDVDTANKQTDREIELYKTNQETALRREIAQGQIDQADRQMVSDAMKFDTELKFKEWLQNSDTGKELYLAEQQRLFDKYVADGEMSVEEAKLAQNAAIASNELNFEQWKQVTNLGNEAATRAWQSAENAKKQAADSVESAANRTWQSAESVKERTFESQMQSQKTQADYDRLAAELSSARTLTERKIIAEKEMARINNDAKQNELVLVNEYAKDMARESDMQDWQKFLVSQKTVKELAAAEIAMKKLGIDMSLYQSALEAEGVPPSVIADMTKKLFAGSGYEIPGWNDKGTMEKMKYDPALGIATTKLASGSGMTDKDIATILQNDQDGTYTADATPLTTIKNPTTTQVSGSGGKKYIAQPLSDTVSNWVEKNSGKIFKGGNSAYRIDGVDNNVSLGRPKGYILITDLKTGVQYGMMPSGGIYQTSAFTSDGDYVSGYIDSIPGSPSDMVNNNSSNQQQPSNDLYTYAEYNGQDY